MAEKKPVVNMDVAVLDLDGGIFDYIPVGDLERKRQSFNYGGKNWIHVGEDEHGRWIYRAG